LKRSSTYQCSQEESEKSFRLWRNFQLLTRSLNDDFKTSLFLVKRTFVFMKTLSQDLLLLLKLEKTSILVRTLSQDLLLSLRLKEMLTLARTLSQDLLLLLKLEKMLISVRTLSQDLLLSLKLEETSILARTSSQHLSLSLRLRETSFRWSENAKEWILLLKKVNVWSWVRAEIRSRVVLLERVRVQLCVILSRKANVWSWVRAEFQLCIILSRKTNVWSWVKAEIWLCIVLSRRANVWSWIRAEFRSCIVLLRKLNVWSWVRTKIWLCVILLKKWRKLYSWERKWTHQRVISLRFRMIQMRQMMQSWSLWKFINASIHRYKMMFWSQALLTLQVTLSRVWLDWFANSRKWIILSSQYKN